MSNRVEAHISKPVTDAKDITEKFATEILKKHKIVVTQNRVLLLQLFYSYSFGMSVSQINNLLPVPVDRTSLYRNLLLFIKKQLITQLLTADNKSKYIHNNYLKTIAKQSKSDRLVYFVCQCCGHTEVVKQAPRLVYPLPGNYRLTNYYVVLNGICEKCNME